LYTLYLCFQGPFDGVLAFSQGASLLSLLCSLQQKESGTWLFSNPSVDDSPLTIIQNIVEPYCVKSNGQTFIF